MICIKHNGRTSSMVRMVINRTVKKQTITRQCKIPLLYMVVGKDVRYRFPESKLTGEVSLPHSITATENHARQCKDRGPFPSPV